MNTRLENAGIAAILINDQSGTVRSVGVDPLVQSLKEQVASWPTEVSVKGLPWPAIRDEIQKLIRENEVTTIVVGGGDGTISAAADLLAGSRIALGILPLGTMNLIAKSLGIDSRPEQALAQIIAGRRHAIDVGRIGGRMFLHHVSIGIQPRMARIREKLGYSSRATKILAGARALLSVLLKPQSMRLRVTIGGRVEDIKTPALLVSNNLYDDSMWLTQKRMDGGQLGIYIVKPMSTLAFIGLALDLLRGRWRDNLNVQERAARAVSIEKRRRFGSSRGIRATLDGEIVLLPTPVAISIEPQSLQVLVPQPLV